MPDTVPPWLIVALKYLGVEEVDGSGDNPTILKFVSNVAAAFPEQAAYAANYKSDDTAWCGVFAANCLAEVGIRPAFQKGNDYLSWMWAAAWKTWGRQSEARVGCVLVFDHHVAFLNRIIDANTFEVIGGNQSSPEGGAVTLSRRSRSEVLAMRWPDEAAVDARPEIELGASGQFVLEVQNLLGITASGTFDAATDAAVRAFQSRMGLEVDGIVGEQTWPALKAAQGQRGLPQELINKIVALAASSEIARYRWADRGVAPLGYIKGMAVTFAHVLVKLKGSDSAARVMASVPTGDDDRDALSWYDAAFHAAGIAPVTFRADTLRRLFVLLIGLGMRESSGRYCEGRDQSATNTSADTAEAGLFQQSWNSHAASSQILMLMTDYLAKPGDGFLAIFKEGVTLRDDSLTNFGSGDGEVFQRLCKTKPAFAVEAAAVGLRTLRKHWGPINRHEAEVRPEADRLLRQVQALVDAMPLDGEVLPPISRDDMMLMLLIFILSEEKSMDANLKAQLLAELGKPNPDMRTLLLKVLGGGPAEIEQSKPAPAPVLGADFDIAKFMPLLQNPTVQKILTAVPLTELLSLIPLVQAIMRGGAVPVQPPLLPGPGSVYVPPTAPGPVAPPAGGITPNAGVVKASAWGLAISTVLQALGVVGTPLGVGTEPTTNGTLATIIPLVTAAVGAVGGFSPLISLGLKLFGGLFGKKAA